MKIGPLFKWFGSKWQSSKRYPKPLFDNIFEPYAGGAGYSLNYVDRKVTIHESNDNLVHLWTYLIGEATTQQVKDIPINIPEGTDIRTLGLTHGQQLLLKHWQRTNNVGNCWTISPWGNKPGQWTANTRARVAEEVNAIKHWKFDCISIKQSGTWFIDPPYMYNYTYGCKNFDYGQLVSFVNMIVAPSQIIACEAICPKTGKVPDYFPFQPNHSSVTSRRKTTENHHSKELLWEKVLTP